MKKIALITLVAVVIAIGGCSKAESSPLDGSSNNGDSNQNAPRTVVERTVVEVQTEDEPEYGEYGSDAYLDGLYDECESGNPAACEDLFMESPSNSEYETFGQNNDWPNESEAMNYGDDPYLDGLYDECAGGSGAACEDLYMESPVDSEYEDFGYESDWGVDSDSRNYGDDPYLDGLYDDCEAGDTGACNDLYWESPVDSEYEEFGLERGSV